MDRFVYVVGGLFIRIDIPLLALFFTSVFMLCSDRFYALGKRLIMAASLSIFLIAVTPLPHWSVAYLENYFPRLTAVPQDAKGIIILGGNFDRQISAKRGFTCHNIAAGRLIEALEIAQTNPHLRLLFTGGGQKIEGALSEAELSRGIFEHVGVDSKRIIWEGESLNTYENAVNSYQLLQPQPDDRWVLVTSAIHMPRAVGLFKKVGFNVIPYPVDYHSSGEFKLGLHFNLIEGLQAWMFSMHEWIGMIKNLLIGHSDQLLPQK